MKRQNFLIIVLIGFVLTVSGCIGSTADNETDLPEADVQVNIGEMYFQQEDLPRDELSAEQGDEILFYNEGDVAHTVTIELFGVDEHLESGDHILVEAEETGDDISVVCSYHGSHEASLEVS